MCTDTPGFKESEKTASAFFRFRNGGPLLRVDHPAAMESYGGLPAGVFYVMIIVLFFVFTVVLLVYLDYVILRRISSLSAFLNGLSKNVTTERQDILEAHNLENDPDLAANVSSKASKRDAPGGGGDGRHSRAASSRHSVATDSAGDAESETDDTSSSSTTSTTNTSTSTSTTTTTTTTTSTATSSSRINSVASSESTVTGITGTSGSSANTNTNTTSTTTSSSSENENSTGGSSSGNKYDKVAQVQKAMNSNIDVLKADITTANVNVKRERRWRRRYTHALRIMNLWCGRKDVFPGLRGRDRPPGSTTTTAADLADYDDDDDDEGAVPRGAGAGSGSTGATTTAASNIDDGRSQMDLNTGIGANGGHGYEDMSVDDVLEHPIAMEFLKVHSRFEESQENIFFLLDATWLQELEKLEEVESDPVKKAQLHDTVVSVADHIVKRYIVKGAPQEINISSESMSIVRKLSGTYSKGMFAKAIYDVKMMTSMDVLSRFKHTTAFLAMSEALDVESYDMMSSAAAVASQKKAKEHKGSTASGPGIANSSISAGEIQVSAPGSGERGGGDLRSDAYGNSDDEEEDNNDDFEEDEDNDNNDANKIDRPFRSTFRLMNAIADGAYRPSGASTSSSSMFSSDGAESTPSDTASIRSAGSRGTRGTRATVVPARNTSSSSLVQSTSSKEALISKKKRGK